LDQFVKHELKARWYVRYVDDFVFVHEELEVLLKWRQKIEEFLSRILHLELNWNRMRLRPLSSGIDFLGYIIHPDHRLVRRRVVGNLCERLAAAKKEFVQTQPGGQPFFRYPETGMERLMAALNSYLAHFAKADAHRLTASLWRRFTWLGFFFGRKGQKVLRRDRPKRIPAGFRRQYHWFARRAGGGVLFFQVGRYYEMMDGQAKKFGPLLGLQEIESRPGFWQRCGFHRRYLLRFIAKAGQAGVPVTVVRETSRQAEKIKERRIAARFPAIAQKREQKGRAL
jgi:hypothetical protein